MSLYKTNPDMYIKRHKNYIDEAISKYGVNNLYTQKGVIYFHHARFPALTKYLLEKKADVNKQDKDGNTLLHFTNDVEISRVLLDNNINVNHRNKMGKLAVETNKTFDIHRYLLTLLAGDELKKYDETYITPTLTIYKKYIEEGGNINDIQKDTGRTFMHDVTELKLLQYIKENGGDIHVTDAEGNTPFHTSKNIIITTELVDYKDVNLYIRNNNGQIPSDVVPDNDSRKYMLDIQKNSKGDPKIIDKGILELVENLIKDGGGFTTVIKYHRPIIFAVRSVALLYHMLINNGNPDEIDSDGNSLLHLVTTCELAELLVNAGADTSVLNKKGQSIIETQKSQDVIDFLNKLTTDVTKDTDIFDDYSDTDIE